MSSKEIITILKRVNMPVNNHMSVMEPEMIAAVEKFFRDVKANAAAKHAAELEAARQREAKEREKQRLQQQQQQQQQRQQPKDAGASAAAARPAVPNRPARPSSQPAAGAQAPSHSAPQSPPASRSQGQPQRQGAPRKDHPGAQGHQRPAQQGGPRPGGGLSDARAGQGPSRHGRPGDGPRPGGGPRLRLPAIPKPDPAIAAEREQREKSKAFGESRKGGKTFEGKDDGMRMKSPKKAKQEKVIP